MTTEPLRDPDERTGQHRRALLDLLPPEPDWFDSWSPRGACVNIRRVGTPTDPFGSTASFGSTVSPVSAGVASGTIAPGAQVAHYRLGEPLGHGGMGAVFRAVDEKLGRAVALKFLVRSGDEQARARFIREARAASALDHPNIGTVYEIGESQGAPYIAMALYEGETLRVRIQRGPLSVDEVLAIARQLASALQAAHASGIVHRDLKPANVMLLQDGTVKLLDFGLAKLTTIDESSLTHEGAILGTLAYMAPEQLRSGEVDARADLWALGAVLYEMLTRRPPFGIGPAAEVVTRILDADPPSLPKEVPADLAALVRALLTPDRALRLRHAYEVARSLRDRRAPSLPRKTPAWLSQVAVGAVLAVAFGAIGLLTARPARQPQQSAHQLALSLEKKYETGGEPSLLFDAAEAYRQAGENQRALSLYYSFLRRVPAPPNLQAVAEHIRELGGSQRESVPIQPKPVQETEAQRKIDDAQRKFDLGKYEEAGREYEEAYELNKDPNLLLQMAASRERAGHYQLALTYYDAARRTGMKDETLANHIGALQAGAPSDFFLPIDDNRIKALLASAKEKAARSQYRSAAADYEAIYELTHDPRHLFDAAESNQQAHDDTRALELYHALRSSLPPSPLLKEVEKRLGELAPADDEKILTPKF
jgi:serine/threonine protein kinase